MQFLVILTISLIFSLSQQTACYFENFPLTTTEEELQISIYEHNFKKYQFSVDCLELLLQRGYYKAALSLYEDYFLLNNIDVQEKIRPITSTQKRDLETFAIQVMTANTRVQIIEPAVQWAQSRDNIFINVKLAMRLDAPACLNCKIEEIQIYNQSLILSAFGILSHQPLRFQLNYSLYDELIVENSTWVEQSVGTIFVSLCKKNNGTLWPHIEDKERLKKLPIWWDMREKHKKDMDDWIEMVEEVNDKKELERKEKKKKEKEQKELEKAAQKKVKLEQEKQNRKKKLQEEEDELMKNYLAQDEEINQNAESQQKNQQENSQKIQEPNIDQSQQHLIQSKQCEGPACGDL